MEKAPSEEIFALVSQIPKGKVSTYKEIASALEMKVTPRAVGKILSTNEQLDIIPCYRVIKSSGAVGGYKLGQKEKIRRLKVDGIEICNVKINNLEKHIFNAFK